MYKIFIVEDDLPLARNISEGISKWNYDSKTVDDFEKIIEEFISYEPDLVLMDINLPYYDGYHWCRKIRDISKTPIIFLSSRDSNMDIIMAVNMGGDDFVSKPFSMEILLVKIQALLRRTYSYGDEKGEIIEVDSAILNINDGTISYNNKSLELTKNEFKILQLLMKNRGKIISRSRIMRALWDEEYFISENTLTVNINRLRKSLEEIGIYNFIITKKSQGYLIE